MLAAVISNLDEIFCKSLLDLLSPEANMELMNCPHLLNVNPILMREMWKFHTLPTISLYQRFILFSRIWNWKIIPIILFFWVSPTIFSLTKEKKVQKIGAQSFFCFRPPKRSFLSRRILPNGAEVKSFRDVALLSSFAVFFNVFLVLSFPSFSHHFPSFFTF